MHRVLYQRSHVVPALPWLDLGGSCCRRPTLWLFREKLTKAGAIKPLLERFDAALRASGYIAMSGQIVDATLVAASAQHG
jgi:hypothetical protein